MDEEEDWDAPEERRGSTEVSQEVSSVEKSDLPRTPQKTVKIADGYKYSYEAHSSPANIDDWADEPSYNSNRSNGYSNSTPRTFRNERGSKRFDPTQKDSWKNSSPRGGYGTPRGAGTSRGGSRGGGNSRGRGGFNKRSAPDWDAPQPSAEDSWNNLTNSSTPTVEEDWDAVATNTAPSIPSTPAPIPTYNSHQTPIPNMAEESWDDPEPAKASKPAKSPAYNTQSYNNTAAEENWDDEPPNRGPPAPIPTYRPPKSVPVNNTPVEESWDDPADVSVSAPVTTQNTEEDWDAPSGVSSQPAPAPVVIPIFRPNNSTSSQNMDTSYDDSRSNTYDSGFSRSYDDSYRRSESSDYNSDSRYKNRLNDRYANSSHSNKYPRGRNYESRGRFREPYDRRSGGSDRGDRGGDRGGRRGGWEDRRRGGGRERGSRNGGRDYRNDNRHSPYPKYDRPPRDSAPSELPTKSVAPDEENWDDDPPSNSAPKANDSNSESNTSVPSVPIVIQAQNQIDEESWD